MQEKEINFSDIAIRSACDIDQNELISFYREVFPLEMEYLPGNWKWLNRSFYYEDKIPLVMLYRNRVIAYAGLIPVSMRTGKKLVSASWFIDFAVHPGMQRYGLGSILTKKWMEFSDIQVTFCNEKSIGVFKKLGWKESFDTCLHVHILNPFNHPRFSRKIPLVLRQLLNLISYPFVLFMYSGPESAYSLDAVSISNLVEFQEICIAKNADKNTTAPVRDIDFFKWRILSSPFRNTYFIYKTSGFSAVISMKTEHGGYMDVLCVSDTSDKTAIKKMISSLGILGLKKGYSRIRFCTSKKDVSDFLKRSVLSFVKHPRFAFFSKKPDLFEKLQVMNWDFELIDSDFEFFS